MRYNYTTKKDEKHKLSLSCFSKCIDWKLNMNMIKNKTSFGLIFQGKGHYFNHLDQSILKYYDFIDKISEVSKSTIKNLEEKYPINNANSADDIKFPLENSENSYLIMENNLEFTENLSNLVFLEFELVSSSHDLKHFKEINNDFVEKEINFVLNGYIHGVLMFKKDLKFSIETRKIIKSIQFRLENYKQDFLEKQAVFQKANPNLEMRNSKVNFFTKIQSSLNIGIEFSTPNFEIVENFATNFNSIVNSNTTINKICFEISLPLINKNEYSKRNRGYKHDIKHNEITKKSVSEFYYNGYINPTPFRADNSTKPYFFYKQNNQYNSNYYSNKYNDSNNNYNKKYYNNPVREFNGSMGKGQYYTSKAEVSIYDSVPQKKNLQQNNYNSYKSEFESKSTEYYLKVQENNLKQHQREKSTKNSSFTILNSHYEGMCNFLIFSRNSTPFLINKNEYFFNKMTLYEYFQNFEKVSVFGLEIPFIYENSIATVNYSPTLSSMEIMITEEDSVEETIENLIKLAKQNQIQIDLKTLEDLENMVNSKEKLKSFKLEVILQENLKLFLMDRKIKIEFYEIKPHHFRQILIDQFTEIFKFNFLKKLILSNLNQYSWFSILWTPTKSLRPQMGNTSFLVYYQFCYTNSYNVFLKSNEFLEIPIIGILPFKLEDNIWLTRIIKDDKDRRINSNQTEFKYLLEKSISNVYDFVIANSTQISVDYELFLKCN